MHSSGASRREIAKPYLMSMSTPHSQPSSPATGSAEWPPDDRLRRAIHYSETSMMESRGRSVLDTPFAGYDDSFWSSAAPKSVTSLRATGSRECAPDDRLREATHTFFAASMDCFAEPVIGRAFARPGGS